MPAARGQLQFAELAGRLAGFGGFAEQPRFPDVRQGRRGTQLVERRFEPEGWDVGAEAQSDEVRGLADLAHVQFRGGPRRREAERQQAELLFAITPTCYHKP